MCLFRRAGRTIDTFTVEIVILLVPTVGYGRGSFRNCIEYCMHKRAVKIEKRWVSNYVGVVEDEKESPLVCPARFL